VVRAAPAATKRIQEKLQFEVEGMKYKITRPAAAIQRIHLSRVPTFFFTEKFLKPGKGKKKSEQHQWKGW